MNDTHRTADTIAWAEEVRAIATRATAPAQEEADPRHSALADRFGQETGNIESALLPSIYFETLGATLLPAAPIAPPAWAASERYIVDAFPERVGIEYAGARQSSANDGTWAQLEVVKYIATTDHTEESPAGDLRRRTGDVWAAPLRVVVGYTDILAWDAPTGSFGRTSQATLTLDSAIALRESLASVLAASGSL